MTQVALIPATRRQLALRLACAFLAFLAALCAVLVATVGCLVVFGG